MNDILSGVYDFMEDEILEVFESKLTGDYCKNKEQ
jgi:hypothetical protein